MRIAALSDICIVEDGEMDSKEVGCIQEEGTVANGCEKAGCGTHTLGRWCERKVNMAVEIVKGLRSETASSV